MVLPVSASGTTEDRKQDRDTGEHECARDGRARVDDAGVERAEKDEKRETRDTADERMRERWHGKARLAL